MFIMLLLTHCNKNWSIMSSKINVSICCWHFSGSRKRLKKIVRFSLISRKGIVVHFIISQCCMLLLPFLCITFHVFENSLYQAGLSFGVAFLSGGLAAGAALLPSILGTNINHKTAKFWKK